MGPHPAVAAIRLAVRRVLHDDPQRPTHSPPRTPRLLRRSDPRPALRPSAPRSSSWRAPAAPTPWRSPPPSPSRPPNSVCAPAASPSTTVCSPAPTSAPHEVVLRLRALGLDPVEASPSPSAAQGGPEAAARDARYAALDAAAERHGATAVLLGHTRDDQAETVLLGLARGSGIRSLSGMAAVSGAEPAATAGPSSSSTGRPPARPAWSSRSPSGTTRTTPTRPTPAPGCATRACPPWRRRLGKGVVEALARTAQLSRDDADALDAWAAEAEASVRGRRAGRLECAKLYALPPAVRRRVLRRAAIEAGAPAGSLFARHIEEVDRLITGWRGQGAINLPAGVVAQRQGGRLVIRQG